MALRPLAPVGVAAAALWLPDGADTAASAVAEKRVEPRTARELGHDRLPVAAGLSAPEMAVRAATEALRLAAVPAAELSGLYHAWMHYQGHDLWSAPHYIAHQLGAEGAVPVGVQQICNGGAAALELAVARQQLTLGRSLALVTTADRFTPPGFDRWRSDYGAAYGDGATAVLLERPAGPDNPLVLRALHSAAAPHLEAMHRGADPFAEVPRANSPVVDMRRTKRGYLSEHGLEGFSKVNAERIRQVLTGALLDAGVAPDDPRIRLVVLPRLGLKTLQTAWIPTVGEIVRAPTADWGRQTGHLGAGDLAAGLSELVRRAVLGPGEIALLLNAGAGFTWSCAVLQAPGKS
ncbi:ketoacyl-ACP synthase III family protein [Allostreptomyces psammosilenae]|uniref:3-oxoacyl-[acyl-carrier-protein] synthase-3 n=1 Tax=Allostreptomyces psammosilenae TaxID=1892865 RepID=A0A853A0Y6_9ACTN|nr:ketoacyl-ACP synthase III family protein [Allostreptomyces psammosilenae]NYI04068.1 3-oxoacyl-[acyl-carrier-protein] synthase-3 [Allostreptomyces psammosilenae]